MYIDLVSFEGGKEFYARVGQKKKGKEGPRKKSLKSTTI